MHSHDIAFRGFFLYRKLWFFNILSKRGYPLVMPQYFYQYNVTVKGRWIKRQLLDLMADEFIMKSRFYYQEAIEKGIITVNHHISSCDYLLREGDSIQHLVHFHEPEPPKMEIIAVEEDFLVVNKPSGIACHPTAGYNLYSVTKSFEKYGTLSCINRLDVVTSGVLILAFKNAAKYHSQMIRRKVRKIYVAKVKGRFPDKITVEKKLHREKTNIVYVSDDGKESKTHFELLKYYNGYSLIECRPETGRSHQIRVHLLSIGFPIINDPVYNENPESFMKNQESAVNQIVSKIQISDHLLECKIEEGFDHKKLFAIENCRRNNTRAFINQNAFICLHAFKYFFNQREYIAELPWWASEAMYPQN